MDLERIDTLDCTVRPFGLDMPSLAVSENNAEYGLWRDSRHRGFLMTLCDTYEAKARIFLEPDLAVRL